MKHEYYNLLGVTVTSSTEEIKKAFRKKAKLLHPDVNPNPSAAEAFKRLNAAYEWLEKNHKQVKTRPEYQWIAFILESSLHIDNKTRTFHTTTLIPESLFKKEGNVLVRVGDRSLNLIVKPNTLPGTMYRSGNIIIQLDSMPDLSEFLFGDYE